MTTNLRICFAIAEDKSTEEITKFQVDSNTLKDFLKDKKSVSDQVKSLRENVEKAKFLLNKQKDMKNDLKSKIEDNNNHVDEYIELIGSNYIVDSLY